MYITSSTISQGAVSAAPAAPNALQSLHCSTPAGERSAWRGGTRVALTSHEVFEGGVQPFRGCRLQQIGHGPVLCDGSPAAVTLAGRSASSAPSSSRCHLIRWVGLLSGRPRATLTLGEGILTTRPDHGAREEGGGRRCSVQVLSQNLCLLQQFMRHRSFAFHRASLT